MDFDLLLYMNNRFRIVLLGVVVSLVLGGCTTSPLVIGFFYGRMDNKMRDGILEVAEFNDAQKTQIDHAVDRYFVWHKAEELPKYVAYLYSLEQLIADNEVDQQTVLVQMGTLRQFSRTAFVHSPFAGSAQFLAGLSDTQVEQIAEYFDRQQREFLERLAQREQDGDDNRRLQRIVKNVERFGITLDQSQQQVIANGLSGMAGSPMQRHQLWTQWRAEFVALLNQRHQADFIPRITAHIDAYQEQMRIHRPQQSLHNLQLTAKMISDVVSSLNPEQQQKLLEKLAETRRSIGKIANG